MSDAFTARLEAALADRYRIERQLGEGGMAIVYLAEDIKHRRRVALKVLRPELTAAMGSDRFLSEIRTTANLQHPNILPLFDSGEADGLLYYVMPYVDGESLRQRLEREHRLDLEEAMAIASDVAEAIQAAHEKGVIHRDIKPANILLSRGRALVADFGIARAAELSEGERLTRTGSSLGTAGYMSPEQAAGSDDVDHRSDIYSLACMVFEMLAGEPPYTGPTLLAVLAKQVTEPVPSLSRLRDNLPRGLEHAVAVALTKDPAGRFASATAFAEALSRPSKTAASAQASQERAVVVLPFVNRSGSEENEYFSDGLTEEVISDLAGLADLRVISRNSAMALKGTSKDTLTLARELGVSHLVTGSVRRAGDALRVTAELVEARTDTTVWTDKFSGTVEDVFGIQEEISQQIVGALEVTLSATEKKQVAARPIDDAVAYDCYLRARREMYLWTPEAQERALGFVNQAMEIVGETPLLLAVAGQIHWSSVNINIQRPEIGLARSMELVGRALDQDPGHGVALFVRGLALGLQGKRQEALRDLYRARSLVPGDSNVLLELLRYSNSSGLQKHGPIVEELSRIDPLNPMTPLVVSSYRWFNGPLEEAAPPGRRAIELMPVEASMLHVIAGWQIAEGGFRDEAREILAGTGAKLSIAAERGLALFLAGALAGDGAQALRHVTPEVEHGISNEFSAKMLAQGYTLLGMKDEAVTWTRRATDMGLTHYPNLAETSPFLEDLRSHPPFRDVLDEVKPRWEALVAWEAREAREA